jgi:hypothetical protein
MPPKNCIVDLSVSEKNGGKVYSELKKVENHNLTYA